MAKQAPAKPARGSKTDVLTPGDTGDTGKGGGGKRTGGSFPGAAPPFGGGKKPPAHKKGK